MPTAKVAAGFVVHYETENPYRMGNFYTISVDNIEYRGCQLIYENSQAKIAFLTYETAVQEPSAFWTT